MANDDPPPSQVDQSFDVDGDEDEVCPVCGDTPCDWVSFGDQIKEQIQVLYFCEINKDGKEEIVDGDGKKVPNNIMRKHLYQTYTYMKYGHLGKGNRMPPSFCVKKQIWLLFPEEDEDKYVDFHHE